MINAQAELRESSDSCGLSGLPHFSDLPAGVRQELQRICHRKRLTKGQILIDAGEHLPYIGCTASGILRMQKTLPDGRQHVVGLLVAGDLFGRVFDGPSPYAIECAVDAEIAMFPKPAFEALVLKSPELDRLVMMSLLNELDRARDWMIVLANPKVRGRLAGFLLIMGSRFRTAEQVRDGGANVTRIHIPISRPDLSHLLGARVESISRALHALANDGIIEVLRPDLIQVSDLTLLAEEAGEPDLAEPSLFEDSAGKAGGRAAKLP
jgi:CRP/FNR family transcriptional regulator